MVFNYFTIYIHFHIHIQSISNFLKPKNYICFPVYELLQNSFVYSNLFIYLFIYFFWGGGGFKFISQSTSCYCEHFKRNLKQRTRSFQQGVSTFFRLYWILSDKYMHGLILIIHNLAGILYKFSYLSILKLRKSIQLNTSFDFSSTKLN